ncbi:MAG: amino acid--[acyl-carrier-protein] ligase [Frankiales bacterium]|nr:amino acid--[acyl-carrier-protein] ligase [Frankiales bacterium]
MAASALDVPQATGSQGEFREKLVAEGLLLPSSVPGVTGQGPAFVALRHRLDRAIDRLLANEGAVAMEFPPIEPRHDMESVGYLTSFPQLAGSVFAFHGEEAEALQLGEKAHAHQDWSGHLQAAGLVMVPAACHPVYPALAHVGVPAGGVTVDTGPAWVFRHEPSDDPSRLVAFHMRELVRAGSPDTVGAWRDDWRDRALEFLQSLGLPAAFDEANDPFFGRSGKVLARSQRAQKLKFEILVPVGGDNPTAVASFNAHSDHFASVFSLGADVHTACLGFGIERCVLALLFTHGLSFDDWPADVRAALS